MLHEGFPGGSGVKNLPAMQEPQGDKSSVPGSGRSPGKRCNNPLQDILAWRIPWREELGP